MSPSATLSLNRHYLNLADTVSGVGWSGCIVVAYWFIANAEELAPPPSIGSPGYIYPNDEICQMYNGVNCTNDQTACCYNEAKWCDAAGKNCLTDVSALERWRLVVLTRIGVRLTLLLSFLLRMEPIPLVSKGSIPVR